MTHFSESESVSAPNVDPKSVSPVSRLQAIMVGIWRRVPAPATMWRGAFILGALSIALAVLGRGGFLFGSSLEVVAISDAEPMPEGLVYFLPKSALEVKVDYKLTRCDVSLSGDDAVVEIEAEVAAEASNVTRADLSRGYVIKTSSIGGGFWNTEFRTTFNKGLLSSFGLRADSTITPRSVVPPVERVTVPQPGVVTPRPGSPAAGDDEERRNKVRDAICGPTTVAALGEGKDLTLGRKLVIEPGRPCPIETEMLVDDRLQQTCRLSGIATVGTFLRRPTEVARQLEDYDLVVQIDAIERPQSAQRTAGRGLVYRVPGRARVTICLRGCGSVGARVVSEASVLIPQFGMEASFPIEYRLFSNREARVEFGEEGELKSVQFVDVATETKNQKNGSADRKENRPSPLPSPSNEGKEPRP